MDLLLVAPAEEGDCDALAALAHRALSPSLLHRRVFGRVAPGDDEAFQAARLRAALTKPGMELLKATRAGKLVGVSLHAAPKSADSTPAPKPKKLFPEGTNLELAHDLFGSSESISEPHFYISILAVEPDAQGSGVGTALLRTICQRAEEQSVSVYLKATPEGMSLYKRFGFQANGDVVRPKADPEIEHWPLTRPPMTFRQLTRDDLPHLARVHRLAFAPTAVVRYLQKDVDPHIFDDFFIRRFDKRLQETDEKQDGSSVFTVARRGDTILGFAWSTREPAAADRPKEDREAEERPLMAGADPVRSREFLGALDRHAKNVPFPHWNLHILSIDPMVQRAGVGRRLVQLVIDRAQAEGLPVTLESTELGLPLYRSMGFKDFAEVLVAEQDETVKLWPMVYGRDEP